jgi:hypothetical protein
MKLSGREKEGRKERRKERKEKLRKKYNVSISVMTVKW